MCVCKYLTERPLLDFKCTHRHTQTHTCTEREREREREKERHAYIIDTHLAEGTFLDFKSAGIVGKRSHAHALPEIDIGPVDDGLGHEDVL